MKNELKFSVGDIVEIVKCKHFHEFDIGEIVTIKTVNEDDKDYTAENDKGKIWWITDDEIKSI